jgi:hypothetical protein
MKSKSPDSRLRENDQVFAIPQQSTLNRYEPILTGFEVWLGYPLAEVFSTTVCPSDRKT